MCVDTTKYVHFLVGKGFYDWKYAFKHLRSRHVARCSVFWGGNTLLGWKNFCSYYIFNKKIFSKKNLGRALKVLWVLP